MTTRTDTWRFDLDSPHIRTMVAYGGRLNFSDHFMPAAHRKAEAENLTILDIDRTSFKFDIAMNRTYVVAASVSYEDNKPAQQETATDASL